MYNIGPFINTWDNLIKRKNMISKISATQLLKQTAEISGEKTEQKSLTMLELALDVVVLLQ